MKKLNNVTLFGLDCVDIDRLIQAAEICCTNFQFTEIKLLTSIPSKNKNVTAIKPIRSLKAYSQFMLKQMNDYINTDFALITQYDGFILNPEAWDDEYLKYDYIGAPLWVETKLVVGNGGFSLRSKKLIKLLQNDKNILIKKNSDHKYGQNEDWIISVVKRKYLENKGIKFAPVKLAHKFSFEKNKKYGAKWNGQFGFHGLSWTDISAWTKLHPEYGINNTLRKKLNKHF
ncbi:MAG: DUF5672 family protein [Patescibacteria group bacterium]|jgi:hypothetical protein